ncbi:MAG: hypothetical protein ACI8YQ_004680 [Polaribacter sp.]|jgi:uncharacterized protein (DUF1015 family)
MRINPFQAIYPDFNYVASTDTFFSTVKADYVEYKKSGFFQKTAQEAFYVYQIRVPERTFTGLIVCSDIRDYISGKVKKHENTLAPKEQQQLNLLISRKAMVKPILITYPEVRGISKILQNFIKESKAFFSCELEGKDESHHVWELSDGKLIQELQELFKKDVPVSYIADGHHRCSATALLYERTKKKKKIFGEQLLSAYFPVTELEIHDYNRVVDALEDCSPTQFMAKLSKVFDITPLKEPAKPSQKHELTFCINKEWYRLTFRKAILKEYKKAKVLLDANMLDEKVMRDVLGIIDIRTDKRMTYVEGPKGIEGVRLESNKSATRIGFCLYPVHISDIVKVADLGKTMPPKSTWFEPRIKNGLIVGEL